jgi:hypothetical protein
MRGKLAHFGALSTLLALPLAGCGSSDTDCAKTATCSSAMEENEAAATSSDTGPAVSDHSIVTSSDVGSATNQDAGTIDADAASPSEDSASDATSELVSADAPEAGPCGVDAPACYVDDLFAIFVSPQGNDTTGTGTKLAPFRSITKAVAARSGSTKHIFACDDGTGYPEALWFNDASGVEALYGGFDCTTWLYDAKRKAKVAPTGLGWALALSALNSPILIESFELDAKDGVAAGESSIAVFVDQAKDVTLKRCVVTAGSGREGLTNAATSNYSHVVTTHSDPAVVGNNATDSAPGVARACSTLCTNGQYSTGGAGTTANTPGTVGLPNLGFGAPGGWVQEYFNCNSSYPAQPGLSPSAAARGDGASVFGHLIANGWAPEPGTAGKTGGPGQGGGGGDSFDSSGEGGGGGCGGCGGAGGPSGTGGGSSMAIVSRSSQLKVTDTLLVASRAGNGGPGGPGQVGQLGGDGGASYGSCFGVGGGTGGTGGAGGPGGGGAGGIAVGIGYQGTAPVLAGTTVMLPVIVATGGAAGSAAGQRGIDGVAQNVVLLP